MMSALLASWGWMRWIRLGLALAFLMAGVQNGDPVAYMAAAFFGVQAIFNLGCCGATCRTDSRTAKPGTGTNVVCEEAE